LFLASERRNVRKSAGAALNSAGLALISSSWGAVAIRWCPLRSWHRSRKSDSIIKAQQRFSDRLTMTRVPWSSRGLSTDTFASQLQLRVPRRDRRIINDDHVVRPRPIVTRSSNKFIGRRRDDELGHAGGNTI